jgi:hypothetical protein
MSFTLQPPGANSHCLSLLKVFGVWFILPQAACLRLHQQQAGGAS